MTKAAKTKRFPEEIFIAGEDFACADNDPLRDAPSAEREEVLEEDVQEMLEDGFTAHTVHCVAYIIPGREDEGALPVAIGGRRTTRTAREANRRLEADGHSKQELQILLYPNGVKENLAFKVARKLNKRGKGETDAQKAEYVSRLEAMGETDQTICRLLEIPFTMKEDKVVSSGLRQFRAVGAADCTEQVRDALDCGLISLSAAVQISKQEPAVQKKTIEDLKAATPEGKQATVSQTKESIGRSGGTKSKTTPGKKEVRRIIAASGASEEGLCLSGEAEAFGAWIVGDIDVEEAKELIPSFSGLLEFEPEPDKPAQGPESTPEPDKDE